MKTSRSAIALIVFLIVTFSLFVCGQDQAIHVDKAPFTVSGKGFICTPVAIMNGSHPALFIIGDGAYHLLSTRAHRFSIAGQTIEYPEIENIAASGNDPEGRFMVIASSTAITSDIGVDEVFHAGAYLVKARRAIKAGEIIPTLLLTGKDGKNSIISIEEVNQEETKGTPTEPEPVLTIFDALAKPNSRLLAMKAWRISNSTVKSITPVVHWEVPEK